VAPKIGLDAVFRTADFSRGLSEYLSGVKQSEEKTLSGSERMTKGLSAIGGATVLGSLALAAAGIAAVGGAIISSIPLASDLSETVSKVGIVFGDSAQQVLDFGSNAATALGMSTSEALAAAGTYGNLFRAMGITEQTSADMSTELVGLAADLASFNNMNPTEVLDKLRAGLSGETEPLRALGVNLNAAAIEAKAMSMGLVESTVDALKAQEAQVKLEKATAAHTKAVKKYGEDSIQARDTAVKMMKAEENLTEVMAGGTTELTAAAKAQASYALILEQTSLAQGDFERTSTGLANQQRIAAAQWKDLRTAIGKVGLNIAGKVMSKVNEILGKLIAKMTIWVGQMDDASTPIGALVKSITDFVSRALDAIPTVITWFTRLFTFLINNKPLIIGVLAGISVAILFWAGTAIPAAITAIGAFMVAMGPAILVIAAVAAIVAALGYAWENNFLGMRDTLTAFWETTVKPALADLWNWLSVNIPIALQALSDFWTNVLLPAINQVWAWIQANLIPLLQELWNWLSINVPLALQTLSDFWNTVLLPAIMAVWNFIQVSVIPLLTSLANVVSAILGVAIEALAGLWQNILLPALQAVWAFIQDSVVPILEKIGSTISEAVQPMLEWISDFINNSVVPAWTAFTDVIAKVVEWLDRVAHAISNLQLPSWLQPGSPTPFELGLRGISSALAELSTTQLPKFRAGLDIEADSIPGSRIFGTSNNSAPSAVNNTQNIFNLGGNTLANGMDMGVFEARIIRVLERQMQ
jgi:hypothetical protein